MRTILVTGVSQGLGCEVARQFAERGDRVLGVGRAADPMNPYLSDYEQVDIGSLQGVPRIAAQGVDVLVNNAAIYPDDPRQGCANVLALSRDDLLRAYEVNVVGPTVLAVGLVQGMEARRYGRVVNVSSGMGRLRDADGASFAYRSSKLALNHLTITLARLIDHQAGDLAAFSYCPGWIRTQMGLPQAPGLPEPAATALVVMSDRPGHVTNGRFFRHYVELGWDLRD